MLAIAIQAIAPMQSPAPSPVPPSQGDPFWWKIVGVVGVILGILAAIQQLTALGNRRRRRAQDRLLSAMEQQIDAERAREDALQYDRLRSLLRQQIDNDLPREARRVYLLNRRDLLSRTIAEEFAELEDIERELEDSAAPTVLDQRVRAVVQETIVPAQETRRRRDRTIVILLTLLLLGTFSPLNLKYLVIAPAAVLSDPPGHYIGEVIFAFAGGAILLSLLALAIERGWSRVGIRTPQLKSTTLFIAGGVASAVGVILFTWGVASRSWALDGRPYYYYPLYADASELSQGYRSVVALQTGAAALSIGLTLAVLAVRRRSWRWPNRGEATAPPTLSAVPPSEEA